jgi:hypothetical protein
MNWLRALFRYALKNAVHHCVGAMGKIVQRVPGTNAPVTNDRQHFAFGWQFAAISSSKPLELSSNKPLCPRELGLLLHLADSML